MKTNLYFHQAMSKIITVAFAGLFGVYSIVSGVREVKAEKPENFEPVLRFVVCSDVHLSNEESGIKNAEKFRKLADVAYELSEKDKYKALDAVLDIHCTGVPEDFEHEVGSRPGVDPYGLYSHDGIMTASVGVCYNF